MTPTLDRATPRTRSAVSTTLRVLFVVYLALLAWIVVLRLELPWNAGHSERLVKLIPFVAGEGFGASAPSEVLANLLLFVPFGLYLAVLAPSWSWRRMALAFAATSLALEVAQYALATGSSDVTDLIVNTAGGLVGVGIVAAVRRALGERRTASFALRLCSAATVLALVAVAWFVASPLHYGPPRGGLDRAPGSATRP